MNIKANARRILVSIFILSLLFLTACGGGGGGTVVVPPIFVLTVGVPVTDSVAFLGFNDYTATVIPGELYKISITGLSDDADLLVFGTDSTFQFLATCSVDNTFFAGTFSEDCVIRASGSNLFFTVDGGSLVSSAGVYTISIELLTVTNRTLSLPFTDTITRTGAGVYAVSDLAPGTYTVGITGLSDEADLYVFGSDGTFSAPALCLIDNTLSSGTTPEDCTLTISGGTLFFIVDGILSSASAVTYTALVTPAALGVNQLVNEGAIGSPVLVTLETPTIGSVGAPAAGRSFYAASGLTAGVRYTVSIMGLAGDADLGVFTDSLFTTPANCLIDKTAFLGTIPESCTAVAPGTTLFFSVLPAVTPSDYIILVTPGP
jgi:hypothetical protein